MTHNKLMSTKILIFFFIFIGLLLIGAKTLSKDIPIEIGILGTMYTFFFGFFINAIFKFLDEKYVNIRILLGNIMGNTQSLFNIVLLTKNDKLKQYMKRELIAFLKSFNELKPEKYYENQNYIDKLFKGTSLLNVKNPRQSQEYSRIIQFIGYLSVDREKLEIFGKKHIKKETKFILLSTTGLYLILIGVMAFSSASLYLNIVGLLLIFMVIFVVWLMFDIDNLSYGTHYIKDKNIEELIEEIQSTSS